MNKNIFNFKFFLSVIIIIFIISFITIKLTTKSLLIINKRLFIDDVESITNLLKDEVWYKTTNNIGFNSPGFKEYVIYDLAQINKEFSDYSGFIIVLKNEIGEIEYYPYIINNKYCIDFINSNNILVGDVKDKNDCKIAWVNETIYIKNNKVEIGTNDTNYKYSGIIFGGAIIFDNITVSKNTKIDLKYLQKNVYAIDNNGNILDINDVDISPIFIDTSIDKKVEVIYKFKTANKEIVRKRIITIED